jgi:hypothetical protein
MTLVDDTPASGSTRWAIPGAVVDADRPGPFNLATVVAGCANTSHVVIRYQCDGPVKAWINNRG